MVKRINSFLNQGEADFAEDKVTDAEQILDLQVGHVGGERSTKE